MKRKFMDINDEDIDIMISNKKRKIEIKNKKDTNILNTIVKKINNIENFLLNISNNISSLEKRIKYLEDNININNTIPIFKNTPSYIN